MLGFVSERIPRSGALGLALMGGAGTGVVGLAAAPILGKIADEVAHDYLEVNEVAVVQALDESAEMLRNRIGNVSVDQRGDVQKTADVIEDVLASYEADRQPPEIETANAFRAIVGTGVRNPRLSRRVGLGYAGGACHLHRADPLYPVATARRSRQKCDDGDDGRERHAIAEGDAPAVVLGGLQDRLDPVDDG